MTSKKRSTFEVVLVTVIVGLTLALGIALFAGRSKVQKGRLLIQELSTLRSGISLYNAVNNKMPGSLNELVDSTYTVNATERPYVEFQHKNSEGKLIDPFGSSFNYEPKTGWVSSSTEGYEAW